MELHRKSFETSRWQDSKTGSIKNCRAGQCCRYRQVWRYNCPSYRCSGGEDRDIDYMPLSVDYEERFYAVW